MAVKITRRAFCEGTALGLALALTGTSSLFGLGEPALAQSSPSAADLMQPGPLPEMALGAETAPVTIIEYASMTCSHCAAFHAQTFPQLKQQYIDTGKVRFIFREFPLDPLAAGAFMLARCAGTENKDRYFALVDTLFHQQKDWVVQKPLPPLQSIAKQAGLSEQAFEQCLANQQVLDGIEKVRQRAADQLGVNSTPTFFINGKIQRGALTMEQIEKEIQPYLKG